MLLPWHNEGFGRPLLLQCVIAKYSIKREFSSNLRRIPDWIACEESFYWNGLDRTAQQQSYLRPSSKQSSSFILIIIIVILGVLF